MKQRYRTLADYFEQTGETQESLADALRISRSYVSMLVSGVRQPALALALQIEARTGVPASALVMRERKAS